VCCPDHGGGYYLVHILTIASKHKTGALVLRAQDNFRASVSMAAPPGKVSDEVIEQGAGRKNGTVDAGVSSGDDKAKN
jgi:hypothetical protein